MQGVERGERKNVMVIEENGGRTRRANLSENRDTAGFIPIDRFPENRPQIFVYFLVVLGSAPRHRGVAYVDRKRACNLVLSFTRVDVSYLMHMAT